MSWLAFNARVMEEAENLNHPVLERLRFLSISASNLDEFYMVRVAGLHGQVEAGIVESSQDGLSPAAQIRAVNERANRLMVQQQERWLALLTEFEEAGIAILSPEQLRDDERQWLDGYFIDRLFPVLTPLAIDPAHPFPFIPNLGFSLALELVERGTRRHVPSLVRVPSQVERFIRLPEGERGEVRFIALGRRGRALSRPAVPRFRSARGGPLPDRARQRHRAGGRGGGFWCARSRAR